MLRELTCSIILDRAIDNNPGGWMLIDKVKDF